MLLEQRIQNFHHLSSSEQIIAQFLLEQKYQIKDMSTRDIAKMTYTSSATVVRFAKKLGYKGFNDLKNDYLQELHYIDTHFQNIDANFPFEQNDSLTEIAGKMNQLFKETMDDSLSLIDFQELQKAIELIQKSETIHIFGLGTSLLYGQRFQYQMRRIKKRVDIETVAGEYGFNIQVIDPQDCAIMISYSGESHSILNHARLLKEKNIPIIAITSLGDNHLQNYADILLHITTREKQYSKIGNFSSEYSIQYILDLLYAGFFALNYEHNINNKIELSKTIEKCRHPQSDIIKEK